MNKDTCGSLGDSVDARYTEAGPEPTEGRYPAQIPPRVPRFRSPMAVLVLAILGMSVLVVWCLPASVEWRDRLFLGVHRGELQAMANEALGAVDPDAPYDEVLVALPEAQQFLSDGGEVVVYSGGGLRRVLIYRYRGLLGSMRGLLYSPSSAVNAWDYDDVKALGSGWYLVSDM